MVSSSYNKAMSQEQIVDLQWAIMNTTNQVSFFQVEGNMKAVISLVEHLETLLCAYWDKEYQRELDGISEMVHSTNASTDLERKAQQKGMQYEQVKLKHRALMKLAMRCGFMPLKKTGKGGMYNNGGDV